MPGLKVPADCGLIHRGQVRIERQTTEQIFTTAFIIL
jgi:hypothetical protein